MSNDVLTVSRVHWYTVADTEHSGVVGGGGGGGGGQ